MAFIVTNIKRISIIEEQGKTPEKDDLLSAEVEPEPEVDDEYDPYYIDPYVLFFICFDVILSYALMLEVTPYELIPKSRLKVNLLPDKAANVPRYTLVLDLDETLIHCELEKPSEYDISFPIRDEYDEYDVYLSFRPYVFHFLETMSQYFELVVFTAGIRPYAEIICSLFNNEKRLIQYVDLIWLFQNI